MAEVRVLLDPGDDRQVSVGLLERHDPAWGRVVVHPTPGARSLQAFAHDVLGALGQAVNRLDAEQLAGAAAAWRAVTAWMVTGQTGELVVLRADRLRAGVWARLLELGRETGTRLLLVCHAPQIPAQLAAVLAGTGHQVLTALPQVLDSRSAYPHPRPWPDAAAGAEADADDLPRFLHPHVDHFGALPYLYMFGGWAGRWHKPLRVFGPSGRSPEFGTAHMVEGMKQMLTGHRDAFSVFPVGQGHDVDVTEFDFRDNGGVCYDENGVKVIHWQRSHAKDGASAYRLEWNGLKVVWTGDGRPSKLDAQFAAGADVYITETQPELCAISSGVQGVPPFLGRYTLDTHHTPGYAAGYVASRANPRLFMTTHMPFDPYINAETVAEVRQHWKGPYHFGAPDGVVVNVTKDDIWVREGVLPDYPNSRSPQFDFDDGQLVVPHPPTSRAEIQEPFIRDQEIPPEEYYPDGYHPQLLPEWPVDSDLVVPLELMPDAMLQGMGAAWRHRQAYKKHLDALAAPDA